MALTSGLVSTHAVGLTFAPIGLYSELRWSEDRQGL